MGNIFRVINYDGDIEVSIYKKANAVFKTNEYNEAENICIHKETINIFNLLKENQELKKQLKEANIITIDYQELEARNKDYKSQQKEFIKYLEDEIESCELTCDLIFNRNKEMKIYKEILQKYKKIIGGNNETDNN